MFDERHLQLTSAYAKSSEYFARTVIAPYLKLVSDIPPFLPPSATSVEVVEIAPLIDSTQKPEGRVTRENRTSGLGSYFKDAGSEEELVQRDLSSELVSEYPTASNSSSDPISSVPTHKIDPNHLQELVIGSAIALAIAEMNFKSLHNDPIEQEHEAWEYLMYSYQLERLNTGRLSAGILNRYSHLEDGGWWCNSGVDPRDFASLEPGDKPDQKLWGCYKPNNKREKAENPGKFIKYEHPPKVDLSIFLLDIPNEIAERIYKKAGVHPTESDRQSGFWYCVWKHNVPVTITEGAKKAASILSQDEAAIGLPGIYAGYRRKDELGNQREPVLHDELAVFATKNRDIKICFHADKWGAITNSGQPKEMLPIERQEFLLVADYLKSGKQLPSVDEDPRKIASTLGSLSLDGTNKILESFKTSEVLQILTQTLNKAGRDDLELGNYRILYEKSHQNSTSVLKLLKTEHHGITRVAASFEMKRTNSGMTHQLKTLAITELDLSKLRLLAQKLHIPPNTDATATFNPHATRDIKLPLHPKLAKQWQDLEDKTQLFKNAHCQFYIFGWGSGEDDSSLVRGKITRKSRTHRFAC